MRIYTYLVCFIILIHSVQAQVTFTVDSLPDYTPPEDILYIAGDFQGWNPGDTNFVLQKNNEDKWFIQFDSVAEGTIIKFKFTRGDWGKVEKGILGEEIPDREFTYGNGESVSIIIYNWADYGGGNSTATENVEVMDEEFYMPQLDRSRRIWIYFPPDYDESENHYPVLYMHDGQNLFDTYTSYSGEWEVDETLNELFEDGYQVPIVVGIDNGGTERINEYTPWINSEYGGGLGGPYIDFVVETLKPYIDDNYRTLPDRDNTAIWGSSLGGLISYYGILKYQEKFSKAGVYSPSYWWSDSVWTFPCEMGLQQQMKIYQMTGSLEAGTMVPDTWTMNDTLLSFGISEENLSTKIIEGGQHNEQLWREDFAEAYLWLFHSFANDIKEYNYPRSIEVYPNPVSESFMLPDVNTKQTFQVLILDMSGRIVFKTIHSIGNSVNVVDLKPGMYLVEIKTDESIYRGKFIKQ